MEHYLMGSGEGLTDEQRESVKKFSVKQLEQDKEMLEKNRLAEQAKNTATLEELLLTKIAPTEDRVVVWPDPVKEFTDGGLLKPQEVIDKERPLTGTVLAVGPGKVDDTTLTNKLLLAILDRHPEFEGEVENVADELRAEVHAKKIPYAAGDRILYGRFAGTPIFDPETNVELLIMRPNDIFAKV